MNAYLARPARIDAPLPGLLQQVEALDEAARAAALREADKGQVVLLIGPDSDPVGARAYLEGLPTTSSVRLACEGEPCP